MITIVGSATDIFCHIILVEVENMKFCDKLIKMRKENNLSQEQFADKLGVSRQAVSKWESGGTYPDMEKILKMCKILNCNLEDLMDDGVIGETTPQKNKISLDSYFKSFLNYITKVYTMFSSMKFKDIVKCLLEFLFIGIIIVLFSQCVVMLVDDLLLDFLLYMNTVGQLLHSIFYNIFQVLVAIIDIVILLHIFKIRYLDYYVIVEDQNVKEKTIESPVDQPKNISEDKRQKEKIIIRDPKHSTFRFFDLLAKIIIFFIKMFTAVIGILFVLAFILFVCLMVISLCHVPYGFLFLFLTIAFIGCILICYFFIHFIYNFMFNRASQFKLLFVILMIGISLIGVGGGLTANTLMNYEYVDVDELEYSIKEEYIDIKENTMLIYEENNLNFVIDNTLKQAKVEMKQFENMEYSIEHHTIGNEEKEEYYYLYYFYPNRYKVYKQILDDVKSKKIRNYDSSPPITIYLSQKDYNKLIFE